MSGSGVLHKRPPARLWLADLDQSQPGLEALEDRFHILSPAEREGYQARASSPTDAAATARWRASRIALRVVLMAAGGPHLAGRSYATTVKGKPCLPDSRWAFNISHAGSDVLIGVTGDGEIGVDLEQQRDVSFDALRSRLIVAAGTALVEAACPGRVRGPTLALLQAWTRLEAIAKARALGLQALLSDLGIRGPASGLPDEAQVAARARHFREGYSVTDLQVGVGRFAAVAASGELPGCLVPERLPCDLASLCALAGVGDEGVGG